MRLGEISVLNPKNELDYTAKVAFVPMSYISGGYLSQYRYDVKNWGDIKKDHSHFATGDIGIAKITPCFQNRKSVIFEDLPSGYGAGSTELSIVRIINKDKILQKYLLWLFKTEYFIVNGIKSFTGTAGQQRIGKNYLSSCLIPLPPVEEQKRISDKINEIFALLDTIDSLQMQCGSNINTLKDKLLTAALTGRLVEQRPEEGTAEELYCQIQEEKERLVKEGKIKKEKLLPEVRAEEEPFEIPETWKWVKLGEIIHLLGGEKMQGRLYPYFDASYLRGKTQAISKTSGEFIHKKDQIVLVDGENSGEVFVAPCDGYMGSTFKRLFFSALMFTPFTLYFLASKREYWRNNKKGVAVPHLNRDLFRNTLIPLPPLEEQKRIVNKPNELLALCRQLEGRP